LPLKVLRQTRGNGIFARFLAAARRFWRGGKAANAAARKCRGFAENIPNFGRAVDMAVGQAAMRTHRAKTGIIIPGDGSSHPEEQRAR
jgi:hypothetical protein